MQLGTEVGLSAGHTVLDRDLLPQKGHSPQFSTHACCGQTAGWIRMPLDRKVGLSPGHIVLDGDPPPPPQRGTALYFRPMSIVVKRSPISATADNLFKQQRQMAQTIYMPVRFLHCSNIRYISPHCVCFIVEFNSSSAVYCRP